MKTIKNAFWFVILALGQQATLCVEAQISEPALTPPLRETFLQANDAYTNMRTERDFIKLNTKVAEWKSRSSEPWFEPALMELVDGIRSKRAIDLTNAPDIVIPSRVKAGIMKAGGSGAIVRQDVFTEGGRSAWLIERLLDIQLPEISSAMTPEQLEDAVLDSYFLVKESLLPIDKKVQLSDLSDVDKLTLAGTPATLDVTLAMLSASTNVAIRKAVAQNSNTPVQILARLAHRDLNTEVCDLAKVNLKKARKWKLVK